MNVEHLLGGGVMAMTVVSSPRRSGTSFEFTEVHAILGLMLFCAALVIFIVIVFPRLPAVMEWWMGRHRSLIEPPWQRCSRCGYNLVASRERCPECGKPIPPWPRDEPRVKLVRGFVVLKRGRTPKDWC